MKRPEEIKIEFDAALASARKSISIIEARKAKKDEPFDFLDELYRMAGMEKK